MIKKLSRDSGVALNKMIKGHRLGGKVSPELQGNILSINNGRRTFYISWVAKHYFSGFGAIGD